jgi:hypothetical protein
LEVIVAIFGECLGKINLVFKKTLKEIHDKKIKKTLAKWKKNSIIKIIDL